MFKYLLYTLLFLAIICIPQVSIAGSGGSSGPTPECINAEPFCSDEDVPPFPNQTNTSIPQGPNYGCLNDPNLMGMSNPQWFYFQISETGVLELEVSQHNNAGAPIDLDFVMWGPFPNLETGCTQVMSGNAYPIQCSSDPDNTETIGLGTLGGGNYWHNQYPSSIDGTSTPPQGQVGEVYIVMLTNANGQSGTISLEQVSGNGATDCSIVVPCDITTVTAIAGDCDPTNDTYSVSGTIEFSDPPETGTLVVSDCNGNQVTFNAPFTNPVNYTISGVSTGTGNCSVTAFFSDETLCEATSSEYQVPADCSCNTPNLIIDNIHLCDATSADLLTAINSSSDPGNYTFYNSQGDANGANNPINSIVSNAGSYWVRAEVQGDSDCFSVFEISVDFSALAYTATIVDENCGDNDGTITLSVNGGTSPFQYSIDNGNNFQNSNSFTNLTAGTYSILITDALGCEATGTETINNFGGPTINSTSSSDISCNGACDGEISIMATGSTNQLIYSWVDANGSSIGTNSNTANNLCAGTYTVTVSDENGCQTSEVITLTEPTSSSFDLSSSNPSCGSNDGEIVISNLTPNATYTISYQNNGNNIGPNSITANTLGNISLSNLASGTYNNFTLIEGDGCSMTNSEIINLVEPGAPQVNAPSDYAICLGESTVLIAGNPDNATISWNNGVVNGIGFTPTETATYIVTASDGNCSSTDQVTITVVDVETPEFMADNLIGCAPHSVVFTNTSPTIPGSTCTWFFGDGSTATGCQNVVHKYTSGGLYDVTLTVETSNGCSASITKTAFIEVLSQPIADFSATPMVTSISEPEIEFTNTSQNANDYTWIFGDDSPNSNSENVSHTYSDEEPSDYIVTLIATNEYGCTDTVRAVIKVQDELIFYIPNTFTPDGDAHNDIFLPIFTSGFDPYDFHFAIYNRWGEMLFESFDPTFGWDGTYGGEKIKDGTYIWKVEFQGTISDERHTQMGHVTIIR